MTLIRRRKRALETPSDTPPDPDPDELPRLALNQRRIEKALNWTVAFLFAAGLTMEILWSFWGHDWVMGLSPKFIMDFENNAPTWFSSTMLSACAVALVLISAVHDHRKEPLRDFFGVLAFVFLLLSIDEAASFHEILYKPLKRLPGTDGFLHFAWVVPGAVFALSVAAWSWKYLKQLPAAARVRFIRAGAVYCAGAVGLEAAAGKYLSMTGVREFKGHSGDFIYGSITLAEETVEMIGVVLFFRALLAYLAQIAGGLVISVETEPADPAS